nr:NADAR family protein [uncultured Flavobacterium sp.]
MKYTIEKLIQEPNSSAKYLFFWGHQPSKDGAITKTCFSQWWVSPFTVDGIEYKTAEHWMMAKKALLFKDTANFERIIQVKSPAEAKKIGREVQDYDDKLWLEHRFQIVKEGNFHKFSQNNELKAFLLQTGNRVLVEASPVDPIWGIGMAADDKNAMLPEQWRGLNLLGFALMEVRDALNND